MKARLLPWALLALFLAFVWSAAARKSETIDEPLFIAGGVAQVELRDANFDLSHPPLLRWLSGISAWLAGARNLPQPIPRVPRGAMDLYNYKLQDAFDWGARFLYDAGNDHDKAVFWGRFPFALFGVLAGLLLFREARARFGYWPAVCALALFCFLPEVLAHAEWAHSDLASAATVLLVALALARALETPSRSADLLFGLALGLAVCVKLTGLLLLPLIALLWGKRFYERWALALAGVYAVIVASYLPQPRLLDHALPWLRWAPLPDSFLKGIVYTVLLGRHGQLSFLHGEIRADGWWYYFPVALFLKYPTPALLLAVAGLWALWKSPLTRARKLALTLPPLILFAAAMAQKIDIGVRSVLTIAPFLALWSAAAFAHFAKPAARAVLGGALFISVAEGAMAWPNFLAWFNPLAGGTAAADRWLVDSNLDWGQDLPELARLLDQKGVLELRLAYFGWARPKRLGIRALDAHVHAPGWYAVSRSFFSGIWGPDYQWLRSFEPVAYAGGSIALIKVDSAEKLMERGVHLRMDEQRPREAAQVFEQVLALEPKHYGAHYQLAAALDTAGERTRALAAWREFLPLAEAIRDAESARHARERIAELAK